jgi:hypothetical protein
MSRILLLFALMLCMIVCISGTCADEVEAVCATTQEPLYVTANSATLYGWADSYGHNTSANVWFSVEDSGGNAVTTPYQTLTRPGGGFSYTITNLQPETDYTVTAHALGAMAHTKLGSGQPWPFHTLAEVVSATLSTDNATDITFEGATLHGAVVSMGTASSISVEFQVRMSDGPTVITSLPAPIQSPGPFSLVLSGLQSETTYYYRAAGTSASAVVTPGDEKSFTTGEGAELTIESSQMILESPTVLKVTGQARNTGTLPLTYAVITVDFKDASGGVLAAGNVDKSNLGLEEVWTWEVTYPLTDISDVASYQAQVAQILTS